GDGRVAVQFVQAAAAAGPDAADRDAQPGADLGVGHRRVFDEQGDQLLAAWRQVAERFAQRSVALGDEQLLLGHSGLYVGDVLDLWRKRGGPRAACRTHGPGAFT